MIYMSTEQRRKVQLCNINYSPNGILHPDRVMNDYDLLYIVNGSWDIIENGKSFHIEKDQLLILEPGLRHYSIKPCTPHMKNMYIHCCPLPGDGIPDSGALRIRKVTDCTSNTSVSGYFQEIIETYWSGQNHIPLRLSALLELLLAEISVSKKEDDFQQPDNLTREILRHFYVCSDRFISPETLAEEFGLSSRTISSRFKKATGQSIHQYQLRLKLNMADEQLPTNPSRGLRDIALSFGFYDEFQFSRLYKRQFGYSPSVRRKGK